MLTVLAEVGRAIRVQQFRSPAEGKGVVLCRPERSRADTFAMQPPPRVVRAPTDDGGAVTRRFGAETLLVPVCGGVGDLDSVYTLNAVGTSIWEAIAQPVTRGIVLPT